MSAYSSQVILKTSLLFGIIIRLLKLEHLNRYLIIKEGWQENLFGEELGLQVVLLVVAQLAKGLVVELVVAAFE